MRYRAKSSTVLRFAVLENLDAKVDSNSAWETNRERIRISAKEGLGYYELKTHKPRSNKGYSKLSDQSKQAKLQRLQDPCKTSVDNLNSVRFEDTRHFRNKKREYFKDKIKELAMNSKNNIRDLYTGINGFKGGYQPRRNLLKDRLQILTTSSFIRD
jgi:hypothetical protein